MPDDFQLTHHVSGTDFRKIVTRHYQITVNKALARISEQTEEERRNKTPLQWMEKYSDLAREDVEELYQVIRRSGCIYFDTEKGMDVSYDSHRQSSESIVANGIQYHFGDSTSEPYYSHWYEEADAFYQALYGLLRKYKLDAAPVRRNIPEE